MKLYETNSCSLWGLIYSNFLLQMRAKCWSRWAGEWLEVPGGPWEPRRERIWQRAMYCAPTLPWEAGRTSDVFSFLPTCFFVIWVCTSPSSSLCSGTWSSDEFPYWDVKERAVINHQLSFVVVSYMEMVMTLRHPSNWVHRSQVHSSVALLVWLILNTK